VKAKRTGRGLVELGRNPDMKRADADARGKKRRGWTFNRKTGEKNARHRTALTSQEVRGADHGKKEKRTPLIALRRKLECQRNGGKPKRGSKLTGRRFEGPQLGSRRKSRARN